MATMLLITSEQAFCFRLCSVASAFVMAPFDMAFPPAFIVFVFMGGNMVAQGKEESESNEKSTCILHCFA